MTIDTSRYRVAPGKTFRLEEIDPAEADGLKKSEREAIEAQRDADTPLLQEYQERLFAEKRQALLIVMLATDTGGKDSTIRRIFSVLNPQGCRVASFVAPTAAEKAHDFLWRIHPHVPRLGEIGIFNRSHYEDVTVPRVHGWIDEATWVKRYRHIRAFEELLADNGTTMLKFHLRISKDEQAKRLRERIEEPAKHWKFDPNDLEDRKHWADFQAAFEAAINATSSDVAPWYVVPANHKWLRDAIVMRTVVETLECMDPHYPDPVPDIEQYLDEI